MLDMVESFELGFDFVLVGGQFNFTKAQMQVCQVFRNMHVLNRSPFAKKLFNCMVKIPRNLIVFLQSQPHRLIGALGLGAGVVWVDRPKICVSNIATVAYALKIFFGVFFKVSTAFLTRR